MDAKTIALRSASAAAYAAVGTVVALQCYKIGSKARTAFVRKLDEKGLTFLTTYKY